MSPDLYQPWPVISDNEPQTLYRLLKYGFDPPALPFAQRATFLDEDEIPDIALITRVVCEVLNARFDIFAVELMPKFTFNADYHCLFHAIADNGTGPGFSCFVLFAHNVN
jgi:hypothetical protein